ncbi:MAG TPA: RdgB/HAM1 family non-canonical purine NTP pyrophosphatase [Candidatus Udaeobacter sp.]|nr:RdgB/HAM1 family non-canonical purine NTP pyrophosphatase [Candidatus Udaeobacter sp.]
MKFVLATFNRDKVRELRAWYRGMPIELQPLYELSGASAPVETGATLEDNAQLKANAAAKLARLPAIADDTGLEIDALNGRPGVRSARYAGVGATDAMNVEAVLEQMKDVPDSARSARFRTVMVAVVPGRRDVIAEGELEGVIIRVPRGANGFGYDPIFQLPEGRTLAELTLEEKNRVSHRAEAARVLAEQLGLV